VTGDKRETAGTSGSGRPPPTLAGELAELPYAPLTQTGLTQTELAPTGAGRVRCEALSMIATVLSRSAPPNGRSNGNERGRWVIVTVPPPGLAGHPPVGAGIGGDEAELLSCRNFPR
jgi:hypothetical protein